LEFQTIPGFQLGSNLLTAIRIQKGIQTSPSTDTHVVAAFRADIQIALQLRTIQKCIAFWTLFPQPFRHCGTLPCIRANHARHDLVQPATHMLPTCSLWSLVREYTHPVTMISTQAYPD